MILIIGLGNPGQKFQKTRHNLGFRVIDKFQKKINFPKFKLLKELSSLISEGKFNGKKIILAKPQTFMNNSGKAVKPLIIHYLPNNYCNKKAMALLLQYLWVIHDDIDLPLSKIRISVGRGAAGHKGVESIIKELGTKNFVRFRIGIKPKQSYRPVCRTEIYVLQKFNKEEEKIIKEVIEKTIEAIGFFLKEGLAKTMTKFN